MNAFSALCVSTHFPHRHRHGKPTRFGTRDFLTKFREIRVDKM